MLARHAAAVAAVAAALALGVPAATARADDGPSCRFVCAPDFKVEPTITFERLGNRARVEETADDGTVTPSDCHGSNSGV